MKAPKPDHFRHFLFNPRLQNPEELERLFVARQETFTHLYEELIEQSAGTIPRHHLIVGQRGMGKTTLLMRLALELQKHQHGFLALTFWEEQHVEVDRLSVFWLNCLDSLADALERTGQHDEERFVDATVKKVETIKDEETKARAGSEAFQEAIDRTGKRLVLFIDNFNLLLLKLKRHDHSLRAFFTRHGAPIIVGAGLTPPGALSDYDAAFYDGFATTLLDRLTLEELKTVILKLSEEQHEPEAAKSLQQHLPRISALRDLSGGNPRTGLLIYRLCARGLSDDVYRDLEVLLDETTPLFQSRFELLSEQGQKLTSRLARHWKPATAEQITDFTGFPRSTVSPLLGRLEDEGIIERAQLYDPNRSDSPSGGPSKKMGYQLAERFFNIWIIMRSASRRERAGIECLSRFLELLFSPEERSERASTLNCSSSFSWDQAVLARALSQTISFDDLKNRADLRLLELHLQGQGSIDEVIDLKAIPLHLHEWAGIKEALRRAVPPGAQVTPEEFVDQVTGSFSILLPQGLARDVVALAREGKPLKVNKIMAELAEESELFESYLGTEGVDWLQNRIRNGRLLSRADRDSITTAIEDCHLGGGLLGLGDIALEGETDLAHRAYSKAVKADPGLAVAWARLARTLFIMKRFPEAKEAFEKAIALRHESAAMFATFGQLLALEYGKMSEAETWLRRAAERDPRDSAIAHNLGATLMFQPGKDKAQQALIEFKREAALDPVNPKPWILMAEIEATVLGQYSESETHYRHAVSMKEKSPEARTGLADLLHYNKGEIDAAEQQYRRAIKEGSPLSATWIGLANLLAIHRGNLEEAEAAFLKATESDDPAKAWTAFGAFLAQHFGQLARAEQLHTKAIEINDKCGLAWYNLASAAVQTPGREEFAKKCLETAIAINPRDVYALGALGNLEFDHYHNLERAEECYQKALEANPQIDLNRHNYAFLLRDSLGKIEAARSLLEGLVQPETWKDTRALQRALFAAHEKNWGIATIELRAAMAEIADDQPPKNTMDDWCRATAVLLNLGYGRQLLEFLVSEGADVRLLPWFAALEAHVVGDRRMIWNIPAEARNAADKLFDQINKRLPLFKRTND